MPTFRPTPDLVMHYEIDDFTDPWHRPETILLLHGNAESGLAWHAWVPALARHYLELGCTFVATGIDILILANGARKLAADFGRGT